MPSSSDGARKFVYVSRSGNIREDSPLETAKHQCEARLQSGQPETVILRPSYFMEMWLSPALGFDPANGSARVYGSGNGKVSYISALDVAESGVAATKKYNQQHTILEMGGPQPLSQLDAAQIFERAWNTKLKLDFVSEQALREQHKSSDPLQSPSRPSCWPTLRVMRSTAPSPSLAIKAYHCARSSNTPDSVNQTMRSTSPGSG